MPLSDDFIGRETETAAWQAYHNLMDELSRVGAGMPAYSLHADPVFMSEVPDLPPRAGWLRPALRGWADRLASLAVPVRRLQRH